MWALQPMTVAVGGEKTAVDLQGKVLAPSPELKLDDSPLFVTGPLTGLPPPPRGTEAILADSVRDFSDRQGGGGWFYGVFKGQSTAFSPLPACTATDWKQEWSGDHPYISLTAQDQHPSADGGTPISAVRCWKSDYDGSVRIKGQFRGGVEGDGVGVSILVDGRRRFRKLLGGGNPVVENFDFTQAVRPGTEIEFAVDPGPATDIDFDATQVSVTILGRAR